MPTAASKPCKHVSCPNLTSEGYCEAHSEDKRLPDRWRGSAASRGYDHAWQMVRLQVLKRDKYLCLSCLLSQRVRPATEVHHVKKITKAPHLRLSLENLMSLCRECHEELEKTA